MTEAIPAQPELLGCLCIRDLQSERLPSIIIEPIQHHFGTREHKHSIDIVIVDARPVN